MNMAFFNLCIMAFYIGILEAAVIKDSFKDEGGGPSHTKLGSAVSREYSEKHTYFEYPLEKPHPGNEYVKISILSNTKLPNPLPDPRSIWNRTVPYVIYKRSSSKEKTLILNVIERFNTHTCLKFVEGSSDNIFITITPKNRLTHSLCRTKEHKLIVRKIRQGIFYDIKFILDFGLTGITKTSGNLSIRKLNSFYDCKDEDGFSYQNRRTSTSIHNRKKRSLGDIDVAPPAPEETGVDDNYSFRKFSEEIEELFSGAVTAESQDTTKDDILLMVTKPTLDGKNLITLSPTDDKSKTIGDSILLRVNEKSTSGVEERCCSVASSSATGTISTKEAASSSTVTVEEGVAINQATSTISSMESPASNAISSTAAHGVKTSTSTEATTLSTSGSSTVNLQPPVFRKGDFVGEKEPYENVKPPYLALRKRGPSNGAKEVILSDSKVVVVQEHAVLEHQIGTEHDHLHGPTGLLTNDEDEEHDGFHQVDVIDGNPIKGRTTLKDPTKLWIDGVIPYVLSDKYDNRQKQLVIEGMEEFHNKTCVKFVKRTNEKSYMFLQPDSRCSATIGKIKDSVNNVTISDGCFVPGIIVHELMHVMGFIHEQNRPDRDSYVMVVWNNIIPKTRGNFRKYRKNDVQDFGQGYDYSSVMHYGMYDFAIDIERPTIIPLKPGTNIGQREGFSRKDLIKVNKLFNCDEPEDDEGGSDIDFRRKPKTVPRNDFKKRFLNYLKKIFRALFVSIQTYARVQI